MAKKPTDKALIEGLILAQRNEGKFVDAAVANFRDCLKKNMSRVRAHAMMSGGFSATISAETRFNFRPGYEHVHVTITGQVSSEFIEESESPVHK